MRHASRITVTAATITVLVVAGVAAALAATPSSGAVIDGNVSNANGEHGIDVLRATGTTTVSANGASFNTQLGINADGDVSDGGGNTATGNGSLHQCENVVCIEP